MNKKKQQKGFALVFVIAVIAALSVMTTSMFFYYDSDLKSVSRNSVMQQVLLASETGLQEGEKWINDQLNADTFGLADIQNNFHIDASNNTCLNRHGYTKSSEDIYFARRLTDNIGNDDPKFEDIEYEVFVQRYADYVRSIYFKGVEARNSSVGIDYKDRSFALVERFNDFPTKQFTIEMWIKNMKAVDDSDYNMHAFEWGREWDLVFKVLDDRWSPRLGEKVLGGSGTVGTPVKQKWAHIAWVWDGGTPGSTDTGNVKIYQDGVLVGTYNADIGARSKSGYKNKPETLPEGDHWPLAIGEGLHGFQPSNYLKGVPKIQGVPWKGNIAEMRIWNISRSGDDIANNNRKRLTGSEPGLVSYYKFNEGAGNIAKDFNTSREVKKRNDATIYGLGTAGTKWETQLAYYKTRQPDSTPDDDTDDVAPSQNVPPGEDIVLYRILSCGTGPQDQLIPLEKIVSAPVVKGDVGDGKLSLSKQDVSALTGQDGSPLEIPLLPYIADPDEADDIKIDPSSGTNSDFYVFKRALEQCTNNTNYATFSTSSTYTEGQCAEHDGKLWYAEEAISADDFDVEQWSEVLGSGCDGIQYKRDGDPNNGHYYKYFTTRPNIGSPTRADAVSWDEARRRAELTTCGGMRGYLVHIGNVNENNFIRDAIDKDTGTTFHGKAGLTRSEMYGSNFDDKDDQHYVWLGNSDWRVEGKYAAESGPDMGNTGGTLWKNFQSGEPNDVGNEPGEDYVDMEINRASRTDGKWNDLPLRPNPSGALDAISGYIVEYGGWDYTDINYDQNNNGTADSGSGDILETTKICYARATIRKAEYVKNEDYLKYDTTFDDAPTGIIADTSTENDSQLDEDSETAGNQNTYPGWNHNTGVLTLIHSDLTGTTPTVPKWSGSSSYSSGDFVWFNNRVWKATTSISGSSTNTSQVPNLITAEESGDWELVDGNATGDPCAPISDWLQAFEGIKYYNSKVIAEEENAGEIEPDDGTDNLGGSSETEILPKLGERTITFSLGPLHIYNHTDGFQHFYEFYAYPTPAGRFTVGGRTWTNSLRYANRLTYFGKQGYMATITSQDESEVLREKVKSTGWLGGLRTGHGDSQANIESCGGYRQLREGRGRRSAPQYRNINDMHNDEIYREETMRDWDDLGNSETIGPDETFYDIDSDGRRHVYQNLSGDGDDAGTARDSVSWSGTKPTLASITTTEVNPTTIANDGAKMTKVWVDTPSKKVDGSSFWNTFNSSECQFWRWVTGPESFMDNGVGLVWDIGNTGTNDWDRNAGNRGVEFGVDTDKRTVAQIGEVFKSNGSPFEDWAKTYPNEPNNSSTEWLAHTVGLGNCDARSQIAEANKEDCEKKYELYWNDLPEMSDNPSDPAGETWDGTETFAPKGIVVEYGGLENEDDPRLRFSTQRVIKLQERQLNQAKISISAGGQSGDVISFGTEELTDSGITATNNNTSSVQLTGEASCQVYVGLLQSALFKHTASTAGQRTVKVSLGNVTKPTNAEHYYQVVEEDLTYAQADFQSSYQNLCGLQGYLAYVKTTEDATAVGQLDLPTGKKSWVNGSDETIGGTFDEREWRFTSGPEYLESFWKVRSGTDASVTNFASANFATNQPSDGGGDYLVWDEDDSQLEQDDGNANSNINSFIIRYGGSVGDYAEADVEEDNNNIDIVLPPLKVEISFYDDGTGNSIYMTGEDTVQFDDADLDGWTKTSFNGNSFPLILTAPTNTSTTVAQFKKKLEKVYYQNCSKDADCSVKPTTYTPGNRKIKITLVYGDTSLNQTIGVIKSIGSRNKVNITPISWSNRERLKQE